MPDAARPYRAPRGPIGLGVIAASIWLVAAILGFQQFGLPTIVFGLALAYSGAAFYAWRGHGGSHSGRAPGLAQTLHVKLTGAMTLVLILDGIAYLAAVNTIPPSIILSCQRAPYRALLRPRDRQAFARTLRATARSPLGRGAWRARSVLPTASQDIDVEVFGLEALLRWQHPKHGLVPRTPSSPLPSRTE